MQVSLTPVHQLGLHSMRSTWGQRNTIQSKVSRRGCKRILRSSDVSSYPFIRKKDILQNPIFSMASTGQDTTPTEHHKTSLDLVPNYFPTLQISARYHPKSSSRCLHFYACGLGPTLPAMVRNGKESCYPDQSRALTARPKWLSSLQHGSTASNKATSGAKPECLRGWWARNR